MPAEKLQFLNVYLRDVYVRLLCQAESESGAEKGQNSPKSPSRMDFGVLDTGRTKLALTHTRMMKHSSIKAKQKSQAKARGLD